MLFKNRKNKNVCHLLLTILLYPAILFAQQKPDHDTSYYTTYPRKITTRFYFSKKFTGIDMPAINENNNFHYKPNTQLNTGLGITYNNLSLNLAYPIGFLNNDDEKGKTKSIDLELHMYPYKWAIDVLGILHRGLYIDPKGYASTDNKSYYNRRDATMLLTGAGLYRVVNVERFSYNAAMIQSEWQKKSAGSLLYGGEFYYGYLKGDSSIIPAEKANLFSQYGINKMQFFTIGAGAGYAYTLVIQKHFYAMGSFIANLDLNLSTEHYEKKQFKKTVLRPSLIYKAAIGYNFGEWNLSANYAGNTLWIKTATASTGYNIPTANYRFILAKRIGTGRK